MRALIAKFVGAFLGAGLMMSATAALACNSGCAPPAPPTRPSPPSNSSSCGCETGGGGGGHHGHGGGGSNSNSSSSADVNVNVNVKSSASSGGSSVSFGSSSGESYGGGYGNWSQTPGTPENVGGLAVDTGQAAAAFDMVSEQRTITRTLVLQASCIDDMGVPHPASQVSPERAIANEYMGEVYRCIAGTHMSVTMADFGICDDFGGAAGQAGYAESETSSYSRTESHSDSSYSQGGYAQGGYAQSQGGYVGPDGRPAGPCGPQALACSAGGGYAQGGYSQGGYSQGGESREVRVATGAPVHRAGCVAGNMDLTHVNFDGGKTMTCQKGDALWFDHGNLTCKVQIQQRQCNERSLLRRFGAGLKVLTVTRTETMQRQVARQVERSSSTATVMTFDGGVGGFVE